MFSAILAARHRTFVLVVTSLGPICIVFFLCTINFFFFFFYSASHGHAAEYLELTAAACWSVADVASSSSLHSVMSSWLLVVSRRHLSM